jgi:Flp pilus assembly protein TadD
VLAVDLYRTLGRPEEVPAAARRAWEVIERHLELYPDDVRALYLGATTADQMGDKELGRQMAERALAAGPDDPSVLYNVACYYATQKDAEATLRTLEAAVDHGFGHYEWAEHDSDLAFIRSSPRFQKLMQRMREARER